MSKMAGRAKPDATAVLTSLKNRFARNLVANDGDGWVDLLVRIGIAVLIGGLVIAFINIFVPDLFEMVKEWILNLFNFDSATPTT